MEYGVPHWSAQLHWVETVSNAPTLVVNGEPMSKPLHIDFVSDISCPWCAVGLASLLQAISQVTDVDVDVHFQPFELNPNMPAGGQNSMAHIAAKYNIGFDEVTRNRERIRERGRELGFAFNLDQESRVYNTFNAHRLLHWAGTLAASEQMALKWNLLKAYFSDNEDVSDRETLARIASDSGLDAIQAIDILDSDRYADDVRASQAYFRERGIQSVPAIIIDNQHLISGGQPPEVFERALRELGKGAGIDG